MALLSALFTLLGRKIGDVLQAVFGWSVSALFGKLSKKKQMMITVALVLSILWPLFVVGVFFPAAATFVIAFIPIKNWVSASVLRIVWIALAVLAPLGVGLLTRYVSKSARSKSIWVSLINGYPLALGFAGSFLITVITVPLVKIGSAVRRWSDEHVFVQPRDGRYDQVLHDLAEAVVWTGLNPELTDVPRRMSLSTQVIKWFSRGAIDELIVDRPKMLRGEGLEVYLYPGDLLVRGVPHKVARVRAMMGRTMLERDAYLVEAPEAQTLQDELGRLWEARQRHDDPQQAAPGLQVRLKAIVAEMSKADIPYEDWVMLDRISRRIEGKLLGNRTLIDDVGLAEVHKAARQQEEDPPVRPALSGPTSEASTVELIEAALKETRELARLEFALAKKELTTELGAAKKSAIAGAVAVVLLTMSLSLLAVSLVFLVGASALTASLVSAGLFILCAIAASLAWSQLPKKPLERTRRHLENDLKQFKEHIA